jgi:hypothetical protein
MIRQRITCPLRAADFRWRVSSVSSSGHSLLNAHCFARRRQLDLNLVPKAIWVRFRPSATAFSKGNHRGQETFKLPFPGARHYGLHSV